MGVFAVSNRDKQREDRRALHRQGERDGRRLIGFIQHYAADAAVNVELAGLAERHRGSWLSEMSQPMLLAPAWWHDPSRGEPARDYIEDLKRVAHEIGLDRLKPGATTLWPYPSDVARRVQWSTGELLLHRWCMMAEWARSIGRGSTGADLISGVGVHGDPSDDVGPIVSREVGTFRAVDGEPQVLIVDERREPIISVQLTDRWEFRAESRQTARQRILGRLSALVDRELEEIERQARQRGYDHAKEQEAERDLTWLFRKLRHHEKYWNIVLWTRRHHKEWLEDRRHKPIEGIEGVPPDASVAARLDTRLVEAAVKRMAAHLGIDHSGW